MQTIHFAVFAAGAALGVTAAALAQRRNDRFTLPMTPLVPTSATPGNTEVSRIPVVDASPTGNLGLARFHSVGSEVFKHGNPGESLHPFICRSRPIAWIETTFVVIFLRFSKRNAGCKNLRLSVNHVSNACTIGPIFDMIYRKSYITAYDRRLRHPAWVRLPVILEICLTQGCRPPST